MYNERLEAVMKRGNWAESLRACEEEMSAHPTDAKVIALTGICRIWTGDLVGAEREFRRATILDPHFADAGVKLAQVLERLGRYEEAFNVAYQYSKERPNDRNLQKMLEVLRPYAKGEFQSWERTSGLNNEVRFSGGR